MEEIGYLVKRAQHALRLQIDNSLNGLDMTLPQYVALSHINEESGISNAELARRAFVTPQTMHRIVTGLELRGLLERTAHPQLERLLQLFLTDEGKYLLTKAAKVIADVERQSLVSFSNDEMETMRVLLLKYLVTIEGIDS